MSAYEKSPQVDLLDYEATRALHESTAYADFAQPPCVTPLFPSSLESRTTPSADSADYMTNHGYSGSPSFDLPGSPVLDDDSGQAPEIVSYSPPRGPEGSKFSVYLQSVFDLLCTPTSTFAFVFGSAQCECIVQSLGFDQSRFQYALSVSVPPFASTGSHSFTVPVQIIMDDQGGKGPQVVQVGVFVYERGLEPPSPSELRKRRMSSVSDEIAARPAKKPPVKELRIKENTNNLNYSDNLSASPYSPFLRTPTTATVYPAQGQPVTSPQPYNNTPSASQPMAKAPSPLVSSWSPSCPTPKISGGSPGLSVTPISQPSAMPSPVKTANPTLIRTSTIQQSLVGSAATGQSQPFNPYAMYPSKAVLKLNGDLDSMAENWSQDERDAQRRLVQFTRHQSGSTIHTDFKPVAPGDRLPNSICISCIYWAGKKECFVTSVDTIYLLESLVGVRFTVEEKNRIRRNLEGFRPLTVSKSKPESEDFFKVIMGFPNPKPRNIEKDVKVFPWKILAHALKKIIGKYSASYSSTAGALPTPLSSNYTSAGTSDASTEFHTASPRSASDSTPSTYGSSLAPAGRSPHMRAPNVSVDSTSVPGATHLQLAVSDAGHQYATLPAAYTYHSGSQPSQSSTCHVSRSSWDFAPFVATSPITMAPMHPHTHSYPRPSSIVSVSHDFSAQPIYSMGNPHSRP